MNNGMNHGIQFGKRDYITSRAYGAACTGLFSSESYNELWGVLVITEVEHLHYLISREQS
jgi:hypothetical protein